MAIDPLSALGLAANVVQFIEFTAKLISKGHQIHKAADGALVENLELEAIIHRIRRLNDEINASLYLSKGKQYHARRGDDRQFLSEDSYEVDLEALSNLLDSKGSSAQDGPALYNIWQDSNELQLGKLCKDCNRTASDLLTALEKLKIDAGTKNRSWKSFRAALKSIWSKEEIEALAQRLESYRRQLDTRILVSIRANIATTVSEQYKILRNVSDANERAELISDKLTGAINESKQWKADIIKAIYKANMRSETSYTERDLAAKLSGVNQVMRSREIELALLCQLQFYEITDRHDMVVEAHKATFQWIFNITERSNSSWADFPDWLENGNGLYWITGKAGSGKSTLMKYLYKDTRTRKLLTSWAGDLPLITAEFYFWNSGTNEQKSQEGLLRTLLYQVLWSRPEIIPQILPKRWQSHELYGNDLHPWTWSELIKTFKTLLRQHGRSMKLCFFVDGLDELDGDHTALVESIQELVSSSGAKFCVSSRPWLCFEDAFGHGPHLLLESLTYSDIVQYISNKFHENRRFVVLKRQDRRYAQQLIDEIAKKSSGVFLWVILVVRSLLKGFSNADRIMDLQRRLLELPADLEELFTNMLDSIEPFYKEHASQLFQIYRAAQEPLSLLQLSFADEDPNFVLQAEIGILKYDEVELRLDDMNRRLKSRCMGLLEAVSPGFNFHENVPTNPLDLQVLPINSSKESLITVLEDSDSTYFYALEHHSVDILDSRTSPTRSVESLSFDPETSHSGLPERPLRSRHELNMVQYLHRTVKDYFEQTHVWTKVLLATEQPFDPSLSLLRSYIMMLKTLQQDDITSLPHLVSCCLEYASLAERNTEDAHIPLLDEMDMTAGHHAAVYFDALESSRDAWGEMKNWTTMFPGFPTDLTTGSNFLSLAIMCDLYHYVQAKLQANPGMTDRKGRSLLFYAVRTPGQELMRHVLDVPSLNMVELLLGQGADPNHQSDKLLIETPWHFVLRQACHIRNINNGATIRRWAEIVEQFIEHGADPRLNRTVGDHYGAQSAIRLAFANWNAVRAMELENLLEEQSMKAPGKPKDESALRKGLIPLIDYRSLTQSRLQEEEKEQRVQERMETGKQHSEVIRLTRPPVPKVMQPSDLEKATAGEPKMWHRLKTKLSRSHKAVVGAQ